MPYTGRLAPSPTGLLHLGHAATFWTAYSRARSHHGTLLLRNEDLDPQRSRPEFVDAFLEDLAWLGITWKPPMLSQSTRLAAYRAAFEQLLASGHVYPCTCSRRDLARMTQAPHEDADDEPVYNGHCRPQDIGHPEPGCPMPDRRSDVGIPNAGCPIRAASSRGWGPTSSAAGPAAISPFAGCPIRAPSSRGCGPDANYRFRVPDAEAIHFNDGNLGPQAFTAGCTARADFGDFLIWRKPLTDDPGDLGLPSYQLACVVDDAFQHITEVVRGADLLKSTARQILLQRALGLPTPAYFHAALLRDEHGVRLAKRHDALALRTLRAQGLTPAQLRTRFST